MNENINPQKLNALLNFAAKKMGVAPNELKQTLEEGKLPEQSGQNENMKKVQEALSNPEKLKEIMNSPAAQSLMNSLKKE